MHLQNILLSPQIILKSRKSHPPQCLNSCLIQAVMRLPCGSINVPSLSSSLSAGKIVGYIMLGILYLYTQLLLSISAYTVFGYFFIRIYHFQVLRMQFQSVSLYEVTISKFAYTTFAYFVIRTGHFTVLRMQFHSFFLLTRHLLSCVG